MKSVALNIYGDFRPTFGGFWSTLRGFHQAGFRLFAF
jgi:hypothetical protein